MAAKKGTPSPSAPRKTRAPPLEHQAPAPIFTVFLDRDGVFDVAPHFVIWTWKGFHWIPGAKQAFARLNKPGIRTSLATNQPFVGLGLLPVPMLRRLHLRMQRELAAAGGRLDHIEYAAVPWGVPSRRRKPGCGMLEDAAAAWAAQGSPVDKSRAVMIGDLPKDAQAAAGFGIPAILVATTHTRSELEVAIARLGLTNAVVATDLGEAVDIVLARTRSHLATNRARPA